MPDPLDGNLVFKEGEILYRIEPATYHGERWWSATVGAAAEDMDGNCAFSINGHGRTPGRALGLALAKFADHLVKGLVQVPTWDSPVVGELMDMKWELFKDGKET